MAASGSGCFWCADGFTSEYHPTCAKPGCSTDTHGRGPEGTITYNYCPKHRSGGILE